MICPGLEYSSWASGNGPVQMFFLIPTRIMFVGKFAKCVDFRLCCRSTFFAKLNESKFVK